MLEIDYDHMLDITAETCPMTYVRVRLALDRLHSGQKLAVRLRGNDPEKNVPLNAVQQGHTLLGTARQANGDLVVGIQRK